MNSGHFYQDKPLFGLDIGFSSLKVMQIDIGSGKKSIVAGYGTNQFDPKAIKDGVIVDIDSIAKAAYDLFKKHVIGEITTRRVAISIPATRTFNRIIKLPKLTNKELVDAIRIEAEQYIPVPVNDLYMDHIIMSRTDKEIELLAVAVPKNIIDSYVQLARVLGLDVVAMETTIASTARLFVHTDLSDVPTVLIDFGSISSDITIFDKALIVTGTVGAGGDNFTDKIAEKLNVSPEEAHVIKAKYGLSYSKKQKEIVEALTPTLELLLKEIRRMIRYYEERYGADRKIKQIVTLGGGANMPGLSDYMTNSLRLPVRMSDPWQHHVSFAKLQPPSDVESSMYVTVAGLALINPKDIFA
jgi:type IV pilus assembly protein PilM